VLAMIADDPIIAKRIADLVRRLSSPSDGEIIAAAHALQRTLEANGLDIHAVADPLEAPNGKHLPEEQMRKVWDTAYARGVQDTENRQHGSDDFIGTDGKPTWQAVALFLQRNMHRLDSKHHEFINKVAARTVWDDEPTERMHKYMHSLFYQLGGQIK
jgi:hypothetical protein